MAEYHYSNDPKDTYTTLLSVGTKSSPGLHSDGTSLREVWTDNGAGSKLDAPFQLAVDAMQMQGTRRLEFNDAGVYIHSAGDGTLDLVSDGTSDADAINIESTSGITLDAGDATYGITYEDDGTQMLRITNSSSDVIFRPIQTNNDIIFQEDGTTEIARFDSSAESLLMASSKKLMLGAAEEYLYGDGTDIHFGVGTNGDINIPANIGLTFGHATACKIEGNGTDIGIDSTGNINITSTVSEVAAIKLNASGANSSIDIDCGTNGFDLDATGVISIRTTKNEANAIYIEADAGTSETIKIHSDQGTGASSIELTSDAGGIDVNAGKGLTIDTADTTKLTMAANAASTKLFSFIGSNADGSGQTDIILSTDGDIHLRSNYVAGGGITNMASSSVSVITHAGIHMGTDLAAVDIAIGEASDSNVLVSDNFKVGGDAYITGALTVNGAISYSTLSVSQEASASTATVLTLDQSSHSDADGQRQSQIVWTGERSGAEEVTMAKIIGAHDGGADDQKGYLEFLTNTSADDAAPTTALKLAADKTATFAGEVHLATTKKLFLDGGSNTYIIESAADIMDFYAGAVHMLSLDEENDEVVINEGGADINFRVEGTGATNALFVDGANGKVGIGNAAPDKILHIKDTNAGTTPVAVFENSGGNEDASIELKNDANSWVIGVDGSDSDSFKITDDTVLGSLSKDRLVITTSGSVAMGVAPLNGAFPCNTLHVSHYGGDADNGIMIVNRQEIIADGELLGAIGFDDDDGNIPSSALESSCFIAAYAAEAHSASAKGGDLVFGCTANGTADDQTSTEYMRILDSGNVGIGTNAPTAALHIDQESSSGAVPVLKLDQADIDDTFIDFIGTSAADGSRSISSDTTTDSAKFGAIAIEINGATKWIRIYDDHS